MNLIEPFKLALKSILSNRLRSILTTLGVIIGVAAVITLVSMGEGAKSYIINQVRGWGVGTNSITIHPGSEEAAMPELTITYSDAVALRDKVPNLVYLVTENVGRGKIKYGKKEYSPSYTLGTTSDYPLAFNQKTKEGRFFSRADEVGRKRFAVIGKTVARKLFNDYSPIGERIKINGIGFIVVGILEEKGSMLTFDMDDMALIPSTLSQITLGTDKIFEVFLTVDDEKHVPQAINDINRILTSRHKKINFHTHTQQGMLDIINNILNALTAVVSAIAAISLLVGGIGIMNIMLVAVTERTREIGIRKAIGAKRRDIFLQFVIEAVLITLTGAFLGVVVGTFASWAIMAYLKLEAVIAVQAATIACLTALLVGLFFGVYPALRAARMDPVAALRVEI